MLRFLGAGTLHPKPFDQAVLRGFEGLKAYIQRFRLQKSESLGFCIIFKAC